VENNKKFKCYQKMVNIKVITLNEILDVEIMKCKMCGNNTYIDRFMWYDSSEYCSEECAKRDTIYVNSKKAVEAFVEMLSDSQKDELVKIIKNVYPSYLRAIINEI